VPLPHAVAIVVPRPLAIGVSKYRPAIQLHDSLNRSTVARKAADGTDGGGHELDLDDELHIDRMQIYAMPVNGTDTRFLPTAEAGGFLARFC
jgi:hypothetical protein